MYTGAMIVGPLSLLGAVNNLGLALMKLLRYSPEAGTAEPAVLICRQKSVDSYTNSFFPAARGTSTSCSKRKISSRSPNGSSLEKAIVGEACLVETNVKQDLRSVFFLGVHGNLYLIKERLVEEINTAIDQT